MAVVKTQKEQAVDKTSWKKAYMMLVCSTRSPDSAQLCQITVSARKAPTAPLTLPAGGATVKILLSPTPRELQEPHPPLLWWLIQVANPQNKMSSKWILLLLAQGHFASVTSLASWHYKTLYSHWIPKKPPGPCSMVTPAWLNLKPSYT